MMPGKKPICFLIIVHWTVVFGLFSDPHPLSAEEDHQIIMGVATSITSLEGQDSYRSVILAVDEINSHGGIRVGKNRIPIRVESVDLRDSDPETKIFDALTRLEKFIQEKKVHGIVVGPFRSEVLLPSMDIIAKHRIPLLETIAMSPAFEAKILKNPKYKYLFRTGLNSKYLVNYLINTMRFLRSEFGFNRVFIMNQDVAWARSTTSMMIKLYFERTGWKILGAESYSPKTVDFSRALKTAEIKGADIILPIFDMPESGPIVRQWKRMGISSMLCGFISPMVGPGAWNTFDGQIAGALNVIFELGNIPSEKYPLAANFYRAYEAKFQRKIEAGHGPAPAYEAVHILADAIRKAGTLDPDPIVKALEATDRVGIMGRIRFHKGHQAIFGNDPKEEALAALIQWSNAGKRNIVYPPAIAEKEIERPPLRSR